MQFGDLLRGLRRAAGLTQEELAERAGLTANGVSALERGTRTKPYPHTVRALAQALELDDVTRQAFLVAAGGTAAPRPRALEQTGEPLRAPPTPFIGRTHQLDRLSDLLLDDGVLLVTLTGPGGVGKTRLAVEAARQVAPTFPGGVRFVDLAPVSDARLIASVVAAGAGAASQRSGARLVVLDNFEHVLDEAPVVADLLQEAPGLTVLVTSRARLRLRAETVLEVPPLTLPDSRRPDVEEVAASSAVMLFVDRARSADPGFTVTPANAADVAAICRRLGGLPLAVELAAAKVRALAPADLLEHLDDALATGWARDLPARQHTLRSALDWSYRLLHTAARDLLRRLSVFAGTFTLDAAKVVWAQPSSPLAALETLVEHSFVTVLPDRTEGGLHYRLLEPVRQYAASQLADSGEDADARARHAAYFLDYAEAAAPRYQGPDRVLWLERTDSECDNLRAAMEWVLQSGDGQRAARLGWALWQPWWTRGQFAEGRLRMEAALRLDMPADCRWRALIVHASFSDAQRDLETARRCWAEALEIARSERDPVGEAWGLAGLGMAAMTTSPSDAERLLHEVLPLAKAGGESWLHALCSMWLGALRIRAGDPTGARAVIEPALRSTRDREDRMVMSIGVVNLAQAAMLQRRDDEAEPLLTECVELSLAMGTHVNMEVSLELLGVIAARAGRWERAVTLQAGAARMAELLGIATHDSFLVDPAELTWAREAARQALSPAAYEQAQARGRAMTLETAARYVLGVARVKALRPPEDRQSGRPA